VCEAVALVDVHWQEAGARERSEEIRAWLGAEEQGRGVDKQHVMYAYAGCLVYLTMKIDSRLCRVGGLG
jgi:hypothetical protein